MGGFSQKVSKLYNKEDTKYVFPELDDPLTTIVKFSFSRIEKGPLSADWTGVVVLVSGDTAVSSPVNRGRGRLLTGSNVSCNGVISAARGGVSAFPSAVRLRLAGDTSTALLSDGKSLF